MENFGDRHSSWSETTTRVERKIDLEPKIYQGGDWSTIETVTVTVVRSGSADTMPSGTPD
ncbi:hypothetical protein [Streptomyces atratus]|uniref:hypothetical protein n=1 Tax=Streptomyces atratus TaxID=1893 RepID=UPI00225B940A|nr:hypothetical protein [Streptomyces atratus]MCX5343365.1 hypothetical protein [Streptomyces atratus]